MKSFFNSNDYLEQESNQIFDNSRKRGKDKSPRVCGILHGNWVHGFGKTRNYDSKKYNAWKSGVLQLYNFRCIISKPTIDLECHHLNGWWWENGRYDIFNGVPLHKQIHKRCHKLYGQGKNTKQQFESFWKDEYGIVVDLKRQQGNHEPSFTIEELLRSQKLTKESKFEELLDLAYLRNHQILSGTYVNVHSKFQIHCDIHNITYMTTAKNYRRAKSGLMCCKKNHIQDVTRRKKPNE